MFLCFCDCFPLNEFAINRVTKERTKKKAKFISLINHFSVENFLLIGS